MATVDSRTLKNHILGGPSPRAFTLIELLIVIAIIAVMVSMMLPTLRGTREAARVVACGASMGQVAAVLNVYENDNRGVFPRLQDHAYGVVHPSFDPSQELDKTWVDLVCGLGYLDADLSGAGLPKTLRCPSASFENDPTWAGQMPNYGVNYMISPPVWLEPRVGQRSFFGKPSLFNGPLDRVIFMIESRHLDNPRGWFGAGNSNWVAKHHNSGNGANVVYLTGNVVLRTARRDLAPEDINQPFAWINYVRQPDP
ncbi:MAG: prepilin-type N-terminal cleavage/methylation domain-containing protein [Planctomycetes bacterium]|nr:prepilin-type N-terminal cleavage/methylation domain-containing protein [Planctomycetota bacterium]